MKKLTLIPGRRIFQDIIDGPGWTDIEVDGYYDVNGQYVPPQYRSSLAPEKNEYATTSK